MIAQRDNLWITYDSLLVSSIEASLLIIYLFMVKKNHQNHPKVKFPILFLNMVNLMLHILYTPYFLLFLRLSSSFESFVQEALCHILLRCGLHYARRIMCMSSMYHFFFIDDYEFYLQKGIGLKPKLERLKLLHENNQFFHGQTLHHNLHICQFFIGFYYLRIGPPLILVKKKKKLQMAT